jgi:hypothetical protein
MHSADATIATYADHPAADAAVRKLAASGFDIKALSVIGKGYHTEEEVLGFYNTADRVRFWGSRGAFWGGLWGLFFGGLFLTVPVMGPVVVLGTFAAIVLSALEGAVVVGAAGAIGAALFSLGVPKDTVLDYEAHIEADGFLVMAHGTPEEMIRARSILATTGAAAVHMHTANPATALAPA